MKFTKPGYLFFVASDKFSSKKSDSDVYIRSSAEIFSPLRSSLSRFSDPYSPQPNLTFDNGYVS